MRKAALSPTSSPPPPLGRSRIGRYDIIYPIAQGGMASVYAGRLSGIAGFQRLVAIKVVHSHLSSEDSFIQMFLDEARLSAGIHHPNVGEVYEIGVEDGLYYMVAELILGQSLRAVFRRAGRYGISIRPALCARIASEVCKGLHAAHELDGPDGEPLGLVHRDVSPRNVLLTYSGFVKLIDFGVAYSQGRISQTDVGTLKGKIGYMSPEQLRCEPVDRRSDVFSLGVLLYQMVTGAQPFAGTTDLERLNKILQYRFLRPSELVPELDPELENIILTAMAWHPDGRYATTVAMAADLESYVRKSGELADVGVFAGLMDDLFAAEQAYHFEKIKEGHGSPSREMDMRQRDPMEQTHPALPRAIAARKLEQRRPKTRAGLAAGAVAAGLVVAGLFAVAYSELRADAEAAAPVNGAQVDTTPPVPSNLPSEEKADDKSERTVAAKVGADGRRNREVATTASAPSADSIESLISVSLIISPRNATVSLDGVALVPGTEELLLPADGVRHEIRVGAAGYRDKTEIIAADRDIEVAVSLLPKAGTKAKRKGKRRVSKSSRPARSPVLEASPYR